MSDFFDEESPWAKPLGDTGFSSFDATGDVSSPWAEPHDNAGQLDEDKASTHSDNAFNPYADPSPSAIGASTVLDETDADSRAPQTSSTEIRQTNLVDQSLDDSTSVATTETAPDLKLKKTKPRTNKKKRGGLSESIKVESVKSDPLASASSSAKNLEAVALTSGSVASLKLHDSEVQDNDGVIANTWSQPNDSHPSSVRGASSVGNYHAGSSRNGSGIGSGSSVAGSPAPTFEINVGDPSTVGEVTNAHTEYTVQMTTNSEFYEDKDAAVQRRYRDFRWLYRTLEHNHPGVIVPPPPEKQALGRFDDDFVYQRRAALEKMLRKIVAHPLLWDDSDLKAFLTSADFGEFLKSRLMADEELEQATRPALNSTDTGKHSSWGFDPSAGSSGGSGFIGSLSGALSLSRGTEQDPWTLEKRQHLDVTESKLREICGQLTTISLHRQKLSDALADFANVVRVLSEIEATRKLSTVLRSFAKAHDRLAQIYARQRKQNLLTLEATLDEYLRIVGSVRDALAARQRVFSSAEHAGSEVEKRQLALDKLNRTNRTQEDRQKALEEEIEQLTQSASKLHQQAGDIAQLVETELARINEEKVEEFRNSVEIYLETSVEAQKESIEIWETFYTQNFAST